MSTDSPLTAARRAVCNAIDHWPAFNGFFKSKLYMERPESGFKLSPPDFREAPSSPSELPSIRVRPAIGTQQWTTNQTSTVPYVISVAMWFPYSQVDAAEFAWCEFNFAMHQSKAPGDTDTFLGRVKCSQISIESFRLEYPRIGEGQPGSKVILSTFGVTVPVRIQPQGQQIRG